MLYLAELLARDTTLRFGYADDICLYQATGSLNNNVQLLASDVQDILAWGVENKIFFVLEKLKMIYLTREPSGYTPQCVVSNELTIDLITTALKDGEQPAL
jgi:hypothetical protein